MPAKWAYFITIRSAVRVVIRPFRPGKSHSPASPATYSVMFSDKNYLYWRHPGAPVIQGVKYQSLQVSRLSAGYFRRSMVKRSTVALICGFSRKQVTM